MPKEHYKEVVMSLFPKFSNKEIERRQKLVKKMMEKLDLGVMLVYGDNTSIGTVTYLSGYITINPTYLVFPYEGTPSLILNFFNHIPVAKEMSHVEDIWWNENNTPKVLSREIEKKCRRGARVGVVSFASIPYSVLIELQKRFTDSEFIDISDEYNWIRWIRSEEEIEWFRKSAFLTDLTIEALETKTKPGMSEHDLNAIVHNSFLGQDGQIGIHMISTTSMHKPEVFCPWVFPTNRKVSKGSVVITEITVGYYSYNAQIHRPFAIGEKPTEVYSKLYDAAYECFYEISSTLKPGSTTKDVLEASSVIHDNGFEVYDSLVHGEGAKSPELWSKYSEHKNEEFTFKENMVVVIQPQPVTRDHTAGLQLGAAVIIRPGGALSLHRYPLKFVQTGF